ncbi:MAG: ROK family protein [Chloroflexi bacterium]|nr:ROK family protein [Chloroflexota bacterium]
MAHVQGDLVVGVDLGGTKIAVAVADTEGRIQARQSAPTPAAAGPEAVVAAIVALVQRTVAGLALAGTRLAALGVGVPGPVETGRGLVWTAPNLRGWIEVPVRDLLERPLGVPVFVENDAKAAALAEHRSGAGRGCQHMVYLTVGTGVGGALVLDGRLYRGASESAGEIGHMILQRDGPLCGAQHRGCLESLASGPALARAARARLEAGRPSLLRDLVAGDLERLTAHHLHQAAQQGDPLALAVLEDGAAYLGQAIASLADILNPELVVIGGGVAQVGEMLLAPVRREAYRLAFARAAEVLRIVPGELDAAAGVVGALLVGLEGLRGAPATVQWPPG